ncbi:MAG: VRR-NUC domain-containing protein [Bacteroidales bacterium]|nr:VRR-NUC domain-containing protein [Bacteroidales bacterium]
MNHYESKLQQACVRYFRLAYPEYGYMLFAVPNGGSRNAVEARILKAEGVVAGVADLILLVPRSGYGSLCIEMKIGKNTQTDNQKLWQQEAEKAGNKYVVVRRFDDFRQVIEKYLNEQL